MGQGGTATHTHSTGCNQSLLAGEWQSPSHAYRAAQATHGYFSTALHAHAQRGKGEQAQATHAMDASGLGLRARSASDMRPSQIAFPFTLPIWRITCAGGSGQVSGGRTRTHSPAYVHPLRLPAVQVDGLHFGDVCADGTVDARAVDAHEDAKVETGPRRACGGSMGVRHVSTPAGRGGVQRAAPFAPQSQHSLLPSSQIMAASCFCSLERDMAWGGWCGWARCGTRAQQAHAQQRHIAWCCSNGGAAAATQARAAAPGRGKRWTYVSNQEDPLLRAVRVCASPRPPHVRRQGHRGRRPFL